MTARKHANNAERQKAYRERNRNVTAQPAKPSRLALRYYGGKWRLAPWIIRYFPSHECYVEPYSGPASVFFNKQPSKLEVLNDLNQDLINFFDVLRTRTDELVRAIDLTPFARTEYNRAIDPVDDPLERARRFYVRCNQARGGSGASMTSQDPGWQFQVEDKANRSVTDTWGKLDHLYEVAARLKQAMIECDNALNVIRRFDRAGTLFYVDPPYPEETRERGSRYQHEMDEADHRELSVVLHAARGKVILSGYQCDLYAELYNDWKVVTKESRTSSGRNKTECLWLSPVVANSALLPLFREVQS